MEVGSTPDTTQILESPFTLPKKRSDRIRIFLDMDGVLSSIRHLGMTQDGSPRSMGQLDWKLS